MKLQFFLAFFFCLTMTTSYAQNSKFKLSKSSPAKIADKPDTPNQPIIAIIDGSRYDNPMIRSGGQYVSATCGNAIRAWKRGHLYTPTNPPRLIPYHEGDVFNCYLTGNGIAITIKTNAAVDQRKKKNNR